MTVYLYDIGVDHWKPVFNFVLAGDMAFLFVALRTLDNQKNFFQTRNTPPAKFIDRVCVLYDFGREFDTGDANCEKHKKARDFTGRRG